jgi:BMFP domain-containing protein YqiC
MRPECVKAARRAALNLPAPGIIVMLRGIETTRAIRHRAHAAFPRGIEPRRAMTQTTNRIFDDLARLMTDAAGAAEGVKREIEAMVKAQGERWLAGMDVVKREEFEAVKAIALKAREENERLEARIAALEARLPKG